MPQLEGDEEEVKEGNRLKMLTPNKLLTRLPILLAQIKAGNNSYRLKNEIRQILYLLCEHNKSLKEFTTIYYNIGTSHYNNGRKYDCNKKSQNFLFWFWLAQTSRWEFQAWNWIYDKKQWIFSWE